MSDDVVARLAAAGFLAPGEEAAELIAAAPDAATLAAWLERRVRGEPLAWITGGASFAGRRVHVAPGVYVPRPQTEELARRAAALLPPGGRALDLCTGSGAVAAHLAAAVPSAVVVGVDLDVAAAACARRNGVAVLVGDLDAAVRGRFDVVTVVPPYVPTGALRLLPADVVRHEPRRALDGGPDGLAVARRAVDAARRLLRPGGWLLVELGGDQDTALDVAGFDQVTPWHDPDGDLRGLAARRWPDPSTFE
jgi:release factor glutamine methyltransferase